MDCLHDLGDPVGALARSRKALKPDGKVLLVEPYAGDRLEENLNPIGRMFYAASAMACTPNSLSQEVGLGLGAQAGEARARDHDLALPPRGFLHPFPLSRVRLQPCGGGPRPGRAGRGHGGGRR